MFIIIVSIFMFCLYVFITWLALESQAQGNHKKQAVIIIFSIIGIIISLVLVKFAITNMTTAHIQSNNKGIGWMVGLPYFVCLFIGVCIADYFFD